MGLFFPSIFEGQNLTYNQALIDKLKAQCEVILESKGANDLDTSATNNLLRLINPSFWNLNIKNNAEFEIERGFEEFMLSVSEHSKEDLNKITTFKFYSLLEHIKSKSDGRKHN